MGSFSNNGSRLIQIDRRARLKCNEDNFEISRPVSNDDGKKIDTNTDQFLIVFGAGE